MVEKLRTAQVTHYYQVTAIRFDPQQQIVDKIKVTPTSLDQSLYLPPEIFYRKEVINKIKSGDDFFINNRETPKVSIKLFDVDGKLFLKTSNEPLQKDFICDLPDIK